MPQRGEATPAAAAAPPPQMTDDAEPRTSVDSFPSPLRSPRSLQLLRSRQSLAALNQWLMQAPGSQLEGASIVFATVAVDRGAVSTADRCLAYPEAATPRVCTVDYFLLQKPAGECDATEPSLHEILFDD